MADTYDRNLIVPIIRDSDFALLPGEKTYELTIRDLPTEQKPREKLLRDGVNALSMAELVAVVLNVGTTREDILKMSTRIVAEYGERSIAQARNARDMSRDLGISLGRASQIIAMVELGRRLFERNPSGSKIIRTAREVYEYAQSMASLPKEHLRGIYLNSRYKVIHDEVVSIGTVDANIIHPREVFKPALEYAAAAVVLVHNHPSGDTKPSDDDIAVTKQLIQAGKLLGIDLIDHVIVAGDGFASVFDQLS